MNEKLITAVLSIFEESLHFRVNVPVLEATEILSRLEKYNFIPANLPTIVQAIQNAAPVTSVGDIRISVGNEYSLVIYVQVLRAQDAEQAKAKLEKVAKKYGTNEFNVEDSFSGSFTARLWWD